MPQRRTRLSWVLLTSSVLSAICAGARASSFDVRPIIIETRDGAGSVVITNPGDNRIYLETQIYDWSSDAAGNPVLAESPTAIASPPAIWVPPHSNYNLRVRLAPPGPGQERAYRVIVRQLPERSDIVAGRITLALSQSLPAFVEPTDMTPPSVTARIMGPQQIILTNAGGRRLQIANVSQDGRLVAKGLAGYVLGRSNLAVRTSAPVHPGQIEAETDLGRRIFELR